MARYIFITGGVVSSLGKGLGFRGARRAAAGARLQGPAAQARPLSQRRSGHDVARTSTARSSSPTTAPRPISISAITSASPASGDAHGQHHHRAHLSGDPRQGAARRLSRRHHPGHPARHQRHQGFHPATATTASISCCARSAARSATSKACRSSRRSASSATICRAHHAIYIHLTLMPYIPSAGELKTKPTQHSVQGTARDRHPAATSCCAAATGRSRRASGASSRCSATCAKAR